MSPVFICIPTPTLGGAEKRFVGLWKFLRAKHDVRLVIQRSLLRVLESTTEFLPLPDGIEVFDAPSGARSAMRLTVSRLHAAHPDAVFHFVMITPAEVQRFRSTRTVFSEPMASLSLFNWKGRLLSRLGALVAGRTDALEETVVAHFQRIFPFRRGTISHTPNSFVDLDFFQPAEKRNRLTFIGLFTETKQAFRLARAVPAIDRALKDSGVERPEFRFLGRETRVPGVREILSTFTGIDAEAQFVTDPRSVLETSKVVFSLQTVTNYPSKALLEGMACGALPIATDVGGTRKIVHPDFGYFVSRDFSDSEIAAACVSAFRLNESERLDRVERMRRFIRERFSIEAMAGYYEGLYRSVARRT